MNHSNWQMRALAIGLIGLAVTARADDDAKAFSTSIDRELHGNREANSLVMIGVHPPGSGLKAVQKVIDEYHVGYPICRLTPRPETARAPGASCSGGSPFRPSRTRSPSTARAPSWLAADYRTSWQRGPSHHRETRVKSTKPSSFELLKAGPPDHLLDFPRGKRAARTGLLLFTSV